MAPSVSVLTEFGCIVISYYRKIYYGTTPLQTLLEYKTFFIVVALLTGPLVIQLKYCHMLPSLNKVDYYYYYYYYYYYKEKLFSFYHLSLLAIIHCWAEESWASYFKFGQDAICFVIYHFCNQSPHNFISFTFLIQVFPACPVCPVCKFSTGV